VGDFSDSMKGAMDTLTAMVGYVGPRAATVREFAADLSDLWSEIASALGETMREAVSEFTTVTEEGDLDTDKLDAVGDWWGMLGDQMGAIADGMEVLTAMGSYVSPARSAIAALGEDILAIGREISGRLKEARESMTQHAVEHAQAFWDSVGALVAMVGEAVESGALVEGQVKGSRGHFVAAYRLPD